MNNSQNNRIEWRRAFIRNGFNPIEIDGKFDFNRENYGIQRFLFSILSDLQLNAEYKNGIFSPVSTTVDESAWLDAIDKLHTDSEGGRSGMDDIDLQMMDTYMAGIVRWVNAAGIKTKHSCDGHPPYERRGPTLDLADVSQRVPLNKFLRLVSDGEWEFIRNRFVKTEERRRAARNREPIPHKDRAWLLDMAEKIHEHQSSLRQLAESAEELAQNAHN